MQKKRKEKAYNMPVIDVKKILKLIEESYHQGK